jgi:uncharacterized protein with FMN-binding domain
MKRYQLFLLLVVSLVFTSASCSKLSIEHQEARNIEISEIDFSILQDGSYRGYYEGGMYRWRENECEVRVLTGSVTEIQLLTSTAEYTNAFLDTLYNRVIKQQTLQVDVVSGSTLDSKACLKAIEDALSKALQ